VLVTQTITREGERLDVPTAVRRIRLLDPALRAYVTTRLDAALAEHEERTREAPRSALHGLPYGLKDEWDTAGMATTGGSYRHRERVPATSSPVHEVFSRAGAILVGKTSLSDMGLAPESSNYLCGATRNPFDVTRTAGGSSGGAAAAVAAGMQAFDWGTDIGGSIRLPAAFCAVLGMRLSSETWPLVGMFPCPPKGLTWMCGQGPIARTVGEMRSVLEAAAPLRTGHARTFSARGASIYVPSNLGAWPSFVEDVEPALRAAGLAPVRRERALPSTSFVKKVYSAVWSSHFEEILDCDPTIDLREGVGAILSSVFLRGRGGDMRFHPATAELLLLIVLGRFTIFRDRRRALEGAARVREAFESLWAQGWIVVAPVCVFPPPRVGRTNYNRDILSCTMPGNLSDATGLSVPFGRFADGLPRGVQLLGPPGSEACLLEIGERLLAPR
jgi:amidase